MKLFGVRIFVNNLSEAKSFCQDVLELEIAWDMEEMGAFGLDVGAQLIVEQGDATDPEEAQLIGRFAGVSLQVNDIEAVYSKLTGKGVTFSGSPAKQPWGGTLAHFKDPSGNTLTLLG